MAHTRASGGYREPAEHKEIGELCYTGYAEALGWRTADGALLPLWDALTEREQRAFREGAMRAMQQGWKRR